MVEPKINGHRLAEFGAEMVEYTVGPCGFEDTYMLPPSRIIPVSLASRIKLRTVTVTLDITAETAHEAAMTISKLTAMLFGEVHLILPDSFCYWCAFTKASTPVEKAPWIWQVKFTFSGFRHGAKQTIILVGPGTIFVDGNVETPATVMIAPKEGTSKASFGEITVSELSGAVTIDGVYTTILDSDGYNKFRDTNMTRWPTLQPGENEISVDGDAVFEVSYYPIWL